MSTKSSKYYFRGSWLEIHIYRDAMDDCLRLDLEIFGKRWNGIALL